MTCDSCGADDTDLQCVHRRYVTPADWDTEGRDVTLDETEQWCFACRSMYPHRPAES